MPRVRFSFFAALVLVTSAACGRDKQATADGTATSTFLDNTSPEAREALALRVDYRLTDERFARWEAAQRNLDRLPRSAFPDASSGRGGNVIDRAVARLGSSPRARTAIESAGLTVRDFILQTIALAQATQAAENRQQAGATVVPSENVRFVHRYRDRIRRAQTAARIARRTANEADEREEPGLLTDSSASAIGIETASDNSSEASTDAERNRPDTANSEGGGTPPPRDTTGDSLLVHAPGSSIR
jgi:hypothetical protein